MIFLVASLVPLVQPEYLQRRRTAQDRESETPQTAHTPRPTMVGRAEKLGLLEGQNATF